MNKDFNKFARANNHISPMAIDKYANTIISSINPTIIEERKLNAVGMDVFSRLMMDRIIFLGEPIDDEVSNIVQAQLLYLASADNKAGISIYLNTPGGSVSAGLGIYDTMQIISPPVSTICTGMAASMGAILLCAGEKGRRAALPHSRVMIHQPLGGVSGQASDILIEAKEIEKIREELYKIITKHSGQAYNKIFRDADRNYWMSASEAKAYGIVDEVLTSHQSIK